MFSIKKWFFKKENGYVRKWAKKERKKSMQSSSISLNDLFVMMIWGISDFRPDGNNINYSGDDSLFEIAVYFCFLTDVWLAINKPNHREEVFKFFILQLNSLFTKALNKKDILEQIYERFEHYYKLSGQGSETEAYIDLLMHFLSNNKTIRVNYDILDEFVLKSNLMVVELNISQAHYNALETFLNCVDSRIEAQKK